MVDFWRRFSVCPVCAVVVFHSSQADLMSRRLPQYNRLRFYNVPAFCRGAMNCSASVDGLFPALIAEIALNISSNRVWSENNSPSCAASLPTPVINRSRRDDACRKIWLASFFLPKNSPHQLQCLTWFCPCLTAGWTWEITKLCYSPASALFNFRTHWGEYMARMYSNCGVIGKH